MLLDEASVTGTANIVMTAVMAGAQLQYIMQLVNYSTIVQNVKYNGGKDYWNRFKLTNY